MPFRFSAYLGLAFLLSEIALAVWRRASLPAGGKSRDRGSLILLWVVIAGSIWVGMGLAAQAVKPWLPANVPWPVIGAAVFAAGAALRWWSIRHLGQYFTVNVAVADDHRLVDNGPYRLVRHPSYTGLLLEIAGLGLTLGTIPALLTLLVPPALALLYRIRVEEIALSAHFPGAYAAYAARTKKLVPLIY